MATKRTSGVVTARSDGGGSGAPAAMTRRRLLRYVQLLALPAVAMSPERRWLRDLQIVIHDGWILADTDLR